PAVTPLLECRASLVRREHQETLIGNRGKPLDHIGKKRGRHLRGPLRGSACRQPGLDLAGHELLREQAENRCHVFSSSSARCIACTRLPRRCRHPAMFIRHPASVATTTSAPVFSINAALSATIAPLMPG